MYRHCRSLRVAASALALSVAMPAMAPAATRDGAGERGYCPARPGLGTTPCTIAPGRVSAEVAVADLDRASDGAVRTDSLLVGDLFLRLGIARTAEVFAEWTPHGTLWTRVPGRSVARTTGMGDVTVGTKINLAHPDGSGLSLAVAPFAGLPVGDRDFGAGEWNYGVQVPASYALSGTLSLQLTTEFDMAADRDGRGRHPAYSMVGGVGAAIAHGLSATVELGAGRDHDPEDTTVQTVAAASVGYMPSPRLQLDAGTVLGLGGPASDLRLYVGISRLF